MNDSRTFELLIFDWDGTLMDSTAMIARSIQRAFADVGLPVPSAEDARFVIGYGLNEAMRHLAPEISDEGIRDVVAAYRKHFFAQSEATTLYEGVEAGLAQLAKAGFRLAIATGKSRVGLDRVLLETRLGGFFEASCTADEAFSKPHPAMLEAVLAQTGVAAERAVMIGDTTHDLQMARNIGMASLAMSYGAHPLDDLLPLQPLAHFDDFAGLATWLLAHG